MSVSSLIAKGGFAARVLTGDRPTGQLHLGHLFGSLRNRVRLQDEGVDLFVLIADYQTITDRDSPASLPVDVEELVADYLAVGIDPARATVFAHSMVPELNQLMLPFLSLVSLPELLRNPTVKDEAANAGMTALNGLMLTYPVHQAADILFRPPCCLDSRGLTSENPIMSEITATDASKRFADMLDAVEHRGESFTVVRRGRAIAVIAPAHPSTLGPLREFVRDRAPDADWERDLAVIRRDVGDAPAQDPWRA